jgi:hypothetical protein
MPMVKGYWLFKPVCQMVWSRYRCQGHADPGGRIPVGAVNFLIQEHPYNTLMGLQNIISDEKYQKAINTQIKEVL